MSNIASRSGRFVVSAKCGDGIIQQTNAMAASAIVLAQSWRVAGLANITVIDPTGKRITPESYRINAWHERQRER